VANGSWKSLAMVDEILYYNSKDCICAYDGSLPVSVSEKIDWKFRFAAAGVYGKKYYMTGYCDGWHMMVYDSSKGLWHEEDSTHAMSFCRHDTDLIYLDADDKQRWYINGTTGTKESTVDWSVTTGMLGYSYTVKNRNTALPEQKTVSRYDFRISMAAGSTLTLSVEYDSSGYWEECGTLHSESEATRSFVIPVRPKRCDHLRYKLEGDGDVKIFSIARILEVGSDVV